jgi:transcriptional regulator with XRE-family HTH domain
MTLLRMHVGGALRAARLSQSRSLRDVAKSARVSLGYLSEVERGQKEASSELLNAICDALGLTLSSLMSEVALSIHASQMPALTVARDAA